MPAADGALDDLEHALRAEWSRVLASLIRFTGSVEVAEDSVQEAIARALATRDRGLPDNVGAWLTTAATRIAIDTARRDAALRDRYPLLAMHSEEVPDRGLADAPSGDDRLGLLLIACAPELPPATRLALALRFVLGVRTETIASALLMEHAAVSQRLTRAKRTIEAGGVVFPDVPTAVAQLDDRVDDVLTTIHLLYTTGHTAPSGAQLSVRTTTEVAVELARALRRLRPDDAETRGLLALLLLTEARAAGRLDELGGAVTLEEADRTTWDAAMVAEGLELATGALAGGGRFALQAGIAGLHSSASTWGSTDWASIVRLYDRLIASWPSPTAILARTVAIGYAIDPVTALLELDLAESSFDTPMTQQAVAARAHLSWLAGRRDEARELYRSAAESERNEVVRDFLLRQAGRP